MSFSRGVLPDDRHFLVTLQITIGSTATFRYADDASGITVEAARPREPARVVAHSGTVLGALLAADDPELDRKTSHVQARCARLGGPSTIYHHAPGSAARREAIWGNADVL